MYVRGYIATGRMAGPFVCCNLHGTYPEVSLNVETEMHYITIGNDILFTFNTQTAVVARG